MIDFRYHLVSLISVFLALAVGIALGAGPLKETIGDTLTGQVEQLRAEKDALRAELDATSGDLAGRRDLHRRRRSAAARRRRSPTVGSPSIALGEVDEADPHRDRRPARPVRRVGHGARHAHRRLDRPGRAHLPAGARRPAAHVPRPGAGRRRRRRGRARLGPGPGARRRPTRRNPDALSDDASVLLELLSSSESDSPLVTVADPVTAPADAIVVVGGPCEVPADGRDARAPSRRSRPSRRSSPCVTAAQQLSSGAVLADGPRGKGSLTDAVLADQDLAGDRHDGLRHRASSPDRSTCRSRWPAGSPAPTATTASATARRRCRPPSRCRRSTARRGRPRARASRRDRADDGRPAAARRSPGPSRGAVTAVVRGALDGQAPGRPGALGAHEPPR